jgi:branched-chain amino acid transport system substrate-binding protein
MDETHTEGRSHGQFLLLARRRGRARTAALLGACLTAVVLTSCGAARSQHAEQLKIAALVSLSGPGASIGTEQARAMRLAVDEVNADGGIDGTKLSLLVADTGSDPARSAQEMRRLVVDEGVVAVLGPTFSREAVRAHPVANRLRTPVLSVSNTARGIVGRCSYPCRWIWRDSLGADRTIAATVSGLVKERRPSTAGLLYAGSDVLATTEAAIARAAFQKAGVRIVGNFQLPAPGSGSSAVAGAVARILQTRPEVLFVSSSHGPDAASAVRMVRSKGFGGPILGGDIFNATEVASAAGQAGRGLRTGAAWLAGNDFPANTRFVRAFRAAFHVQPDQFAAQAYAGIEIISQAISRAEAQRGGLSIAQRRQAIQRGLGQVALTTPLGRVRFTRDHDVDQIVWILELDGRGDDNLVQFCNPGC